MTTKPRERGILFSAPMVRALLAGTKTQTRRIADRAVRHPDLGNLYDPGALILEHEPQHVIERACPLGRPGDRLWVREAWRMPADLDGYSGGRVAEMCIDAGYRLPWAPIQYEADGAQESWRHTGTPPHDGPPRPGRYRHARFMPRWASRLMLEITGVRVERLQDISGADAVAEGVSVHPDHHTKPSTSIYSPVQAYRDLWEIINGAGSWDANPWVWVVEFRRLEGGPGS